MLAFALALGVQRTVRPALRLFFRSAYFLPLLTSAATISIVMAYMFHSQFGVINYYLGLIGVPRIPWLEQAQWALISVVLVYVWHRLGFTFIVFSGGMGNLPKEVLEAADVDGATGWRRLWYIVLPMLSPEHPLRRRHGHHQRPADFRRAVCHGQRRAGRRHPHRCHAHLRIGFQEHRTRLRRRHRGDALRGHLAGDGHPVPHQQSPRLLPVGVCMQATQYQARTAPRATKWSEYLAQRGGDWLRLALLFVASIIILAPVIWTISTSLRTPASRSASHPSGFPCGRTLRTTSRSSSASPSRTTSSNSFIVTGSIVLGQLVTASLAGYAFARLNFPFRSALFWLVMATVMVPLQATIIPVFVLISSLGLADTLAFADPARFADGLRDLLAASVLHGHAERL